MLVLLRLSPQEQYRKDLTLKEAEVLALSTLKQVMEEKVRVTVKVGNLCVTGLFLYLKKVKSMQCVTVNLCVTGLFLNLKKVVSMHCVTATVLGHDAVRFKLPASSQISELLLCWMHAAFCFLFSLSLSTHACPPQSYMQPCQRV